MGTTQETSAVRSAITHTGQPAPARLVQRIRAEYMEMPGLALTPRQAARLWGEDVRQVVRLLGALVDDGFLVRNRQGAYRRSDCPRCS
jgi:hypothetical protein